METEFSAVSTPDLVAAHAAAAIQVTPQTAITRWTGEALDLDVAVDWLMQASTAVGQQELRGGQVLERRPD